MRRFVPSERLHTAIMLFDESIASCGSEAPCPASEMFTGALQAPDGVRVEY